MQLLLLQTLGTAISIPLTAVVAAVAVIWVLMIILEVSLSIDGHKAMLVGSN